MTAPDIRSRAPSRRIAGEWRWLATLAALALPVFLLGLASPGLYDPHESLYAEVAREMVTRGDWLTPYLNGTRYLDKPPLFYWLIGLSYTVFGVSEFAARLPVALAGLGGVLLTWSIGRRLFGDRVAFVAGLALTASLGYFVFSRQILPDMVLSFFMTCSLYGGVRGLLAERHRPAWAVLFYAGLACGVLTKGIVGLFPLAVIGLYLALTGQPHRWRTLIPLWGGMLIVAVTAPWHVLMAWQNDGYFWHYVVNEHVLRFLGRRDPIDYVTLPLPVFLLIAFLWLLPWSPYLVLPVAWGQRPKGQGDRLDGRLLLLLWAGSLLIFFALSRARLPQYSLPALPALALLIGTGLEDRFTGRVASITGLFVATAVSLLLPIGALVFIPVYIERYHGVGMTADIVWRVRMIFSLLAGGSAVAMVSFYGRRWRAGLLGLTCGVLAAFVLVHQVLVQLEPWRSSRPLAALINAQHPGEKRIVLEIEKDDPFEYERIAGLVFYTGQPVELLRRKNPPKPSVPLRPGERFLLGEAEFERWWIGSAPVFLVTDSFGDGAGLLDPLAQFTVVGHIGSMWVIANAPP
jgi:4-amino-4-deoxy-L-arabinose transferase-like glycosyltransferase